MTDKRFRPGSNLPEEVRIHVQVPGEMYSALRDVNVETGVPVTEFIRRAVQARLDERTPAREARIVGSPAPVLIPNRETR
jgi:hypothetical protein